MADVQILRAQAGRRETLNSTAWYTACSIPAGSFTAGDKYLIIARADLMYSGTSDEVKARLVRQANPASSSAYLVVADSTSLTTLDQSVKSRLEGLGWTVTAISDETAEPSMSGYSLVVIAESCVAATLGTKYATVGVPVVLLSDGGAGQNLDFNSVGNENTTGSTETAIRITDPEFGASAGYPFDVTVWSSTGDMRIAQTSSLGSGGRWFCSVPSNNALKPGYYYEAGATMANSHGAAEARRIFLGWFHADSTGKHTSDAWALFDAAIKWASTTPTQFTDAYEADEVLGNKVVGVGFMAVYTQPGTTEAVTLEYASSTTAQEAILLRAQILAINLDDIGTQSTDYWWSEDTTDHVLTTTPTDGASVTFTPNGTDKYLYLAQVAWHPTDVSVMQTFHGLLVDGNVKQQVSEEGEDATQEYRNRILMWAETPTNASHTVKVQGWMESSNTSTTLSSRVLVLNLAKFSDAHIATGADDQITEYLQDTFTRSVSADGLGTADSGHTYSVSDSYTGAYSVNGSNALLASGTGTLTAYASQTVPKEFMVSGDVRVPTGIGSGDVVSVHLGQWTGSTVYGAGLEFYWNGSAVAVRAFVQSSTGKTTSSQISTVTAGDWYSLKGIVRDGLFLCRVWLTSTNEPYTTWHASATHANTASQSSVGWQVTVTGTVGDVEVDNFRVWDIWSNALTTSFTPAASGDYVVLANPIEDYGSNQDPDAIIRFQINPDGNGLNDYPGTLKARDTFTEASGTPLLSAHAGDGGRGWRERWQEQSSHWYVNSTTDRAILLGGTDDYAYVCTNATTLSGYTNPLYLGDGYIEFQVPLAGDGVGMHVRWKGIATSEQATEDCYRLWGNVLYRVTNGSSTSLGSVTGSGDWYRLYASGSSPTQLVVQRAHNRAALDDTYASEGYTLLTSDSTAENQTASGEVGLWGLYDEFGTSGNIDNVRVVDYGSLPDVPHGGAWDASDESPYLLMDVVPFTSGASRTINIDHRFEATLPENGTAPSLLDPVIVAFSKALAGGASTQNVTLTLLDSASTIYSLTAIPDQPITLTLLDPISAIYAPTAAHASIDVTLTLLTTEVTGNGGLVPLLLAQPQIEPRIFPLTVAFGSRSTALELLDPASAIYDITVTSHVDVVLTQLDPISAIYDSTITTENTIDLTQLDPISSIYSITALPQPVAATLTLLDPVSTIYNLTVVPDQLISPVLLDPSSAIYDLSLTTENSITLVQLDPVADIYSLTLVGKNAIDLTLVDPASAIYDLSVIPIQIITVTLLDPTSNIYNTTVTTENTVELTLLDPISDVYAPSLSVDIALDLIDLGSAIYAPTVGFTVHLALIDPVAAIYDLTATGAYQDVELSLLTTDITSSGGLIPLLLASPQVAPRVFPFTVEQVGASPQDITATLLDPTSAIYDLTVSTLNSIDLVLLDPSSAIYAATVTTENDVDLTLLDSGSSIYDLVASTTNDIDLVLLGPVSTIYDLTVTTTNLVELTLVDPVSDIYDLTVSTVNAIDLTLLDPASTTYDLAVEPQAVTVTLTLLDPLGAVYELTLTSALGLTLLDPSSAIYDLSVQPDQFITVTLLDPVSDIYAPSLSVTVALTTLDPVSDIYAPSLSVSVDLTLLDSVSAIYAVTVEPQAVTVDLTLLDPLSAIYDPVISSGSVAIELTLLDPASTTYDPSVGFTVALTLVDPVPAIYGLTLTTESTVALTLLDPTSVEYDLSVTPTNAIALGLLDPSSAIYDLTVVAGAVTVELTLIDSASAVYDLTVASGLGIPIIDTTAAIYDLTVYANQTVDLTLLDSGSDTYDLSVVPIQAVDLDLLTTDVTGSGGLVPLLLASPTIAPRIYAFTVSQTANAQDIDLTLIDQSGVVYDPSLGVGVDLGFIDQSGVVYDLSLAVGPVTVELDLLDPSSAVYDLTILIGQSVTLDLLDPSSAIYDLTVAAGPVSVELTLLDPGSTTYDLSLTGINPVALTQLDPSSTTYELTLVPGVVSSALTLLDPSSEIFSLTVIPAVTQDVELSLLDPNSTIYAIRIPSGVRPVSNLPNVWYPYPYMPDEIPVAVGSDLVISYRIVAKVRNVFGVEYRVANKINRSFETGFRVRAQIGRSSVLWWKQRRLITAALDIEYDNFGAKLDRFWEANRDILLGELDVDLKRHELRQPRIDPAFWEMNRDILLNEIDPDFDIGGQHGQVEGRDVRRGLLQRPRSRRTSPDEGRTLVRTHGSGGSDE